VPKGVHGEWRLTRCGGASGAREDRREIGTNHKIKERACGQAVGVPEEALTDVVEKKQYRDGVSTDKRRSESPQYASVRFLGKEGQELHSSWVGISNIRQ